MNHIDPEAARRDYFTDIYALWFYEMECRMNRPQNATQTAALWEKAKHMALREWEARAPK